MTKIFSNKSILVVGSFLSTVQRSKSVGEELAEHLSDAGWRIILTSRKLNKVSRLIDMLCTTWVRRNHYQVAYVEVYSGLAFFWAEAVCWFLRRAKKPFILTLHGGNLPFFTKKWPHRVPRLLKSASVVTAPSRYLQSQMQEYQGNIHLLPNAINLAAYTFKSRNNYYPRIIWIRAFHEIYNPMLTPEVISILTTEWNDIHLTMVGADQGDGSLQKTIQLIERLGLTSRVELPGRVPKSEVNMWLQKCDIFLNTANIDNAPVSILEAMACGLAIVSTNVGGIQYLLKHEHDALLVPPDDPIAMSKAIRRILDDHNFAKHLSFNARKNVEKFDWANVLPQWEQLFNRFSRPNSLIS
jgi:glycosyltransferase involved in cell wall biosynthesis